MQLVPTSRCSVSAMAALSGQPSMATCRWDELKKARAALWHLHDRCAAAQGPSGTGVDASAQERSTRHHPALAEPSRAPVRRLLDTAVCVCRQQMPEVVLVVACCRQQLMHLALTVACCAGSKWAQLQR